MKINWVQKLSSRKFWLSLAAWVTSALAAFKVADITANQVTVIISGIGALVVYVLAESAVDVRRGKAEQAENSKEPE